MRGKEGKRREIMLVPVNYMDINVNIITVVSKLCGEKD